jgi:cell fate regulator YaaT (PSP1 superfamily)
MGCTNCGTKGCGALTVYDWLDNMLPPGINERNNIYEVRFKSTRKGFFINYYGLEIVTGDYVAVEIERGYDVGTITMGGELVRLQMKKKRIEPKYLGRILRIATDEDRDKLEELRAMEKEILVRSRAIIHSMQCDMKLSEVEFQADGSKIIFYYTADTKIDYRDLIKVLGNEFKTRIEMKQLGHRQEAALLGGVGSCGRELCCSSWLTDFKSVTTAAARYQNISVNPAKIAGQCGKLKCCLNYELDVYIDALRDIPDVRELKTETGVAYLQKTDIFMRKMWFSYGGDSNWIVLDAAQVLEYQKLNKSGVILPSLMAAKESVTPATDYINIVDQSEIHDKLKAKRKSKNRSSRNKRHKNKSSD